MKPFIKTKPRDPKPTDFSKHELVVNINEGSLFYKSNKGIHKLIPASTTALVSGGGTSEINNFTTQEITNEYITNNTETINNYSFFTANGNDIYYSTGNIGIGISTPSNPLTVTGADSIGIDDYIIHNSNPTTLFGFPSDDTFKISTSGTDRMTISDGKIGIGTPSPAEQLEINGNLLLNIGNIRSTGDLDLLTDGTDPHAEDKAHINIKSTVASTDIHGDLNLLSNHTLNDIEQDTYNGLDNDFTIDPGLPGPAGGPSFTTYSYGDGYFNAGGIGNFTCEGDAAIGKFLTVGWSTGNSGTPEGATLTQFAPLGSIQATGKVYAQGSELTSDINLKKNIVPLEDSLNKILSLKGVNYEWKDKKKTGTQYGLIAQEVEKIIPELVTNGETKYLNYTGIIPILIEAIKEQQKQIEELKSKIK